MIIQRCLSMSAGTAAGMFPVSYSRNWRGAALVTSFHAGASLPPTLKSHRAGQLSPSPTSRQARTAISSPIASQDYVENRDPQLERAVAEALRLIEERPALEPKPGERPRLGR